MQYNHSRNASSHESEHGILLSFCDSLPPVTVFIQYTFHKKFAYDLFHCTGVENFLPPEANNHNGLYKKKLRIKKNTQLNTERILFYLNNFKTLGAKFTFFHIKYSCCHPLCLHWNLPPGGGLITLLRSPAMPLFQ